MANDFENVETNERRRYQRMERAAGIQCAGAVMSFEIMVNAWAGYHSTLDDEDTEQTTAAAQSRLAAVEPTFLADLNRMIELWATLTNQNHISVLAKLGAKYADDQSESRLWLKLQIGLAIDAL